jgi:predicted HD phosphohydrolase
MSELNRSPLADPGWQYLEKIALEDLSRDDWHLLEGQRQVYLARHQAEQALRLLSASEHDPCFGYQVNNYRHSLQSATMVLRDGLSEEDVVVALLHDVGFIACPMLHGDFAATLLGAYVPGVNQHERERWRGHEHFEWTAEFVARYDQAASDPAYACEPLQTFIPMVKNIFSRKPQDRRSINKENP